MYTKSPPKTTPKDERLAKLHEMLCQLEATSGDHADEIFIRESAAILEYAESVLPQLALAKASTPYLAKVHQQAWSRKHHG